MNMLEHVERARAQAVAHWKQIEAEQCPSCTMQTNLGCRYRGTEVCKLKPELDALQARAARRRRLEVGGVPRKFWAEIEAGPDRLQAIRAADRLIAGEGLLLCLAGRAGCGKTMAGAYAISRMGGRFLRSTECERPLEFQEVFEKAPLLVIDDVGTEASKGFAGSKIAGLIRVREEDLRPTILTTNCEPKVLADEALLGARIASRLDADPLGYVKVTDPDQRGLR